MIVHWPLVDTFSRLMSKSQVELPFIGGETENTLAGIGVGVGVGVGVDVAVGVGVGTGVEKTAEFSIKCCTFSGILLSEL